jgi:hypothetical protein
MIAAFVFTQLLAAQEPKISLELPILPLQSVLRELEAKTGQLYRVSGPDTEQRVFVSVKDLTPSRIRAALAEVTHGRWIQADQTYTLETVSPDWLKDRGFRESVETWYKAQKPVAPLDPEAIAKSQRESVALSDATSFDEQKMRKLNALQELAPSNRFIRRLVGQIPLAEMTSLQEGERKVFALEPTSLQKKFGPQAANHWASYLAEMQVFQEKASLIPDRDEGVSRYWNPILDPFRQTVQNPPSTKFLLALSRSGSLVTAALNIYWEDGTQAASDRLQISGQSLEPGPAPQAEKSAFDELAGLTEKIEIDPEDAEFEKDMAKLRQVFSGNTIEISQVTRERLLNMDKQDPLLFGPSRLLKRFTQKQNKSVVAKVTDLSFLVSTFSQPNAGTPTMKEALTFSFGFFGRPGDAVKVTDDLITLRPPVVSVTPFPSLMDRSSTAKYLKVLDKKQDAFDALALVFAASKSIQDALLPAFLGGFFDPSVRYVLEPEAFEMLKLYGMLTSQQKSQARASEVKLSLAALSPQMLRQVNKMVLWSEKGIRAVPEPAQDRAVSMDGEEVEDSYSWEDRSWNSEPTNALTRVSSTESWVEFSFKTQDRLMMVTGTSEVDRQLQAATPNTVAWALVSQEMNPGRQYGGLQGFVQGEQDQLNLTLNLGKAGVQKRVYKLPRSKGGSLMKFSDLPADFQAKVAPLKEQYRQSYRSGGSGGGAVKPP